MSFMAFLREKTGDSSSKKKPRVTDRELQQASMSAMSAPGPKIKLPENDMPLVTEQHATSACAAVDLEMLSCSSSVEDDDKNSVASPRKKTLVAESRSMACDGSSSASEEERELSPPPPPPPSPVLGVPNKKHSATFGSRLIPVDASKFSSESEEEEESSANSSSSSSSGDESTSYDSNESDEVKKAMMRKKRVSKYMDECVDVGGSGDEAESATLDKMGKEELVAQVDFIDNGPVEKSVMSNAQIDARMPDARTFRLKGSRTGGKSLKALRATIPRSLLSSISSEEDSGDDDDNNDNGGEKEKEEDLFARRQASPEVMTVEDDSDEQMPDATPTNDPGPETDAAVAEHAVLWRIEATRPMLLEYAKANLNGVKVDQLDDETYDVSQLGRCMATLSIDYIRRCVEQTKSKRGLKRAPHRDVDVLQGIAGKYTRVCDEAEAVLNDAEWPARRLVRAIKTMQKMLPVRAMTMQIPATHRGKYVCAMDGHELKQGEAVYVVRFVMPDPHRDKLWKGGKKLPLDPHKSPLYLDSIRTFLVAKSCRGKPSMFSGGMYEDATDQSAMDIAEPTPAADPNPATHSRKKAKTNKRQSEERPQRTPARKEKRRKASKKSREKTKPSPPVPKESKTQGTKRVRTNDSAAAAAATATTVASAKRRKTGRSDFKTNQLHGDGSVLFCTAGMPKDSVLVVDNAWSAFDAARTAIHQYGLGVLLYGYDSYSTLDFDVFTEFANVGKMLNMDCFLALLDMGAIMFKNLDRVALCKRYCPDLLQREEEGEDAKDVDEMSLDARPPTKPGFLAMFGFQNKTNDDNNNNNADEKVESTSAATARADKVFKSRLVGMPDHRVTVNGSDFIRLLMRGHEERTRSYSNSENAMPENKLECLLDDGMTVVQSVEKLLACYAPSTVSCLMHAFAHLFPRHHSPKVVLVENMVRILAKLKRAAPTVQTAQT